MIRLTDEEILDAIRSAPIRQYFIAADLTGGTERSIVAKAQLKKVVEYLIDRWNGTEWEGYNIVAIPKEEWQALLKEIEGE